MFEDAYAKIPRDEIEAKALKELMGLNIELPKARLLAILREEGGDPDCAAARAFIEMRNQYREARGEKTESSSSATSDHDDDQQQHIGPSAPQNYFSQQEEDQKNYYDPTYRGEYESQQQHQQNIDTNNNNNNQFEFDDYDDDTGNNNMFIGNGGGSFDMTFDASIDEHDRKPSDPEDGRYMLRVRSKEYYHHSPSTTATAANAAATKSSYSHHSHHHHDTNRNIYNNWPDDDNDDDDDDQQQMGMMRARSAGDNYYGRHREQERSKEEEDMMMNHNDNDESHQQQQEQEQQEEESSSPSSEKRKFPGVFMKTFSHGGCVANKNSFHAGDGHYMGPYSFVNDGIRIIRLDSDSDRTHHVNLVDTSSLEDDDFEALCEEWLDERYDASEVPDMFHEGQDYRTAKAKSDHDLALFGLYSKFEGELRNGFSLQGCLTTFFESNEKIAHEFRVAAGIPNAEDIKKLTGGSSSTSSAATTAAKPGVTAKVKTTGTGRRDPKISAEKYSGDVTRNVANVSRTFSVSVRLPRTCTVLRVEVVRNTYLEKRFDRYCEELRKQGIAYNIGTGYHGTRAEVVDLIAENGFICPLEGSGGVKHKSGNDGFYGNGNYQSPDPNIAYWYSQGSKMLVTKCARGRVYHCPSMMMGADLQPGYDSHESPGGDEWVFYRSAAVLPVAIIHFSTAFAARPAVTTLTKATIKGRAIADYKAKLDEKAGGGVHLSNKDRKALNRARNAQIQTKKPKRK